MSLHNGNMTGAPGDHRPELVSSCCHSLRLVAVGGGIGSGKSVVSRMLAVMGFDVYDCDKRAKRLMAESDMILDAISDMIAENAVCRDGAGCRTIDRKVLADVVFADKGKLSLLNSIVHGAVREDLRSWAVAHGQGLVFVESAIVIESGLHNMVDEIWNVEAPVEVRISRAISRDNATREHIVARMASQQDIPSEVVDAGGRRVAVKTIVNDGLIPVLPQVLKLLETGMR